MLTVVLEGGGDSVAELHPQMVRGGAQDGKEGTASGMELGGGRTTELCVRDGRRRSVQ